MFELVRTFEVDAALGVELVPLRVELFRSTKDTRRFRYRLWRLEFYRIQPSFPQEQVGLPAQTPSDEEFLVDWSAFLTGGISEFIAESVDEAVGRMADDLRSRLEASGGSMPL